jgi:cobalamin biosynthesis protein CobT
LEPEPERVFEEFDLKSAVDRKLKVEGLTGKEARGRYLPYSTKADAWHHRRLETDKSLMLRGYTARAYDQRLERMQGEVNAIRRKLERALVSKQQRDWVGGQESGRLDSRRFAAVMAGRTNVFKQKTDRAELDTALTILVDLSGSMSGYGKASVARDCVMAVAEAVDRTGIA